VLLQAFIGIGDGLPMVLLLACHGKCRLDAHTVVVLFTMGECVFVAVALFLHFLLHWIPRMAGAEAAVVKTAA
jgi:prepilin signal peptidase PulO-like enzyme (type II secretory pathway)